MKMAEFGNLKTIQVVLIMMFWLWAPGLHAQELFTFSESVEILVRNNAELRVAEEALEIAKNQRNSAYGNFLPEVSAGMNYKREQKPDFDGEGFGAEVVLLENIFNGFRDLSNLDDAKAKVAQAEANLKTVKAKLSHDLKSSFASLIYAHENVKLAESIQNRRSDNLSLVQLRFQSGRENKGSVLLSSAYLQESQVEFKKAQLNLEIAKTNYLRVLGLPFGKEVDIKGTMPEASDAGPTPHFLELVLSVPDRVSAAARLKSTEALLQSSRAGFYPTMQILAKAGKNGPNYFPENPYWSIETSFSWSLFSGGKTYFGSKTAFADKMVAENNLRNLDLSLATSLKTAYSEFVIALENYKVSQAFVDAQNVRAEIGRGKYNNGLSTFDDWDVIENDLINRQKNLIERRRDKVIAEASWEKAQGRGVVP